MIMAPVRAPRPPASGADAAATGSGDVAAASSLLMACSRGCGSCALVYRRRLAGGRQRSAGHPVPVAAAFHHVPSGLVDRWLAACRLPAAADRFVQRDQALRDAAARCDQAVLLGEQ